MNLLYIIMYQIKKTISFLLLGICSLVGINATNLSNFISLNENATQIDINSNIQLRAPISTNLIFTEIMPANIDLYVDPSWNFGGFIELYNPTSSDISLSQWYLSDDPNNLKKWRMPISMRTVKAYGYRTIWFGHNDQYCTTQCQFDLSMNGGTIYLSNNYGQLVASQEYPVAISRVSYSRKSLNSDDWGWTSQPTPDAANSTSSYAIEQLDAPEINKNGQVFTGNFQFYVNIPNGATLRYTTNGTTPTLTNGNTAYDGNFNINKTTVYRFRLFKDGYLPSEVVTRSFILKEKNYNIPILSIVTDNNNINGADYGIFVKGNGHGRTGRGQSSKCNWNMDWDRPVNVEYFEDGKEAFFSQEVNMAAVGGWSRAWSPHSFKLKANKVYGINYLPYTFFKNKPFIKNKTLQVRNGGNDTQNRIKDAAIQEVVLRSGIDVDCQSYIPAFVYINGVFYEVLNIREPNNKHFAYANRGLDDDEMDQFEYSPDSAYVQMAGTNDAFKLWYAYAKKASSDDYYERIKELVDIDEFANYFAVEMYLGSNDWLNNSNNVKAFRPAYENGKFRFVLFDLDAAFSVSNMFTSVEQTKTQTLDKIYDTNSSLTKEIELTTIWLNMLKNQTFKRKFADAFTLVAGSVFEPNRCKEIITEIAQRANTAMSQQSNQSNYPWNTANNVINSLSSNRQTSQFNTMKNYLQLSNGVANGSFSANIPEANLLFNDMPIPTNKFSGQFFVPATIKAETPGGYKFVGWRNASTGSSTPTKVLFGTGSNWSYYDKGSLDGQQWTSIDYNSSSWSNGNAPLGYATKVNQQWGVFNTQINWGNDEMNKYTAYYYRKNVSLSSAPTKNDRFELSFTADDGFVIYVNGVEAGRFNMNDGKVSYSTLAIKQSDNMGYPQIMSLDPTLFKTGNNVIAVEVHNNIVNSSDSYWDASLSTTVGADIAGDVISTNPEYTITSASSIGNLVAVYTKLSDEELKAKYQSPIRINEISAANSIYINEYWKKNDWIELYNTTDESIDLAGMYLSDNINKPTKYQIPNNGVNSVIEPHGYKVIWCDKLQNETQLHASFKLANEEALILLSDSKQTWGDTLQYYAHNGDQTFGRFPDGSNNVYIMNIPTIGSSNTKDSYDMVYNQPYINLEALGINEFSEVNRDGDIGVAYSNNYIIIKNENLQPVKLYVTSLSGQIIDSANLDMRNGNTAYEVALNPGVYIANVIDSEGRHCSIKFVVK